jgi:hypothetical protein
MNQQEAAPTAEVGKIITAKEAARILRIHPKTLDRMKREGRGPRAYQPQGRGRGHRVYYLEHEVRAYVLGGAL